MTDPNSTVDGSADDERVTDTEIAAARALLADAATTAHG